MRFFTSPIAAFIALSAAATIVSATLTPFLPRDASSSLNRTATAINCTVFTMAAGKHGGYIAGHAFVVGFINVPDASEPTICGSTNKEMGKIADEVSCKIRGMSCFTVRSVETDRSTMMFWAFMDKQATTMQLHVVSQGVKNAFGTHGVDFSDAVCGEVSTIDAVTSQHKFPMPVKRELRAIGVASKRGR